MSRALSTRALLIAAALLAAGCSRSGRRPAPTLEELRAPTTEVPAEATGVGALRSAGEVRHAGLRRVTLHEAGARTLEYLERVESDGAGRFSLTPVEALTAVPADWSLLQIARQGFLFRYRDFAVRHAGLFAENWRLVDTGERTTVAGRACVRQEAVRVRGREHRYLLSVDEQTGLVLAYEELGPAGTPIARVAYESFDAAPDLSGAIWFEPRFDERPLETARGELEVPLPRRYPSGYALVEAVRLEAGAQDWTKLTFTDGVEPLFYLHRPPPERAEGEPVPADEILLFRMGTAAAAQASLAEGTFVAVGKVDEQVLADLVESALP